MTPDYDLSNLHADQADLWMCLQIDGIIAGILADQPERWVSPLAICVSTQGYGVYRACETAGGTQQYKTGSGPIHVGLGDNEVN